MSFVFHDINNHLQNIRFNLKYYGFGHTYIYPHLLNFIICISNGYHIKCELVAWKLFSSYRAVKYIDRKKVVLNFSGRKCIISIFHFGYDYLCRGLFKLQIEDFLRIVPEQVQDLRVFFFLLFELDFSKNDIILK